jgi:NAD(P)-dependent dehydrogenase (short-subunit alcohol dehydrogenase family)
MSLKNKLITLTGAASGIGLATARILARRGALLSLADYNSQTLKAAHEELSSLSTPKNVISTSLDIRSSSAVNNWIRSTKQHFGRTIDGCANIAGFHPVWTPKNVEDITDEEFDQVIAINTTGLFRCLRAQLSAGILSSPASIVNVGSVSGLIGFSGDAAYVASKHAAHGLTKCAAKEAGPRGIRVNVVAPGQSEFPFSTLSVA